MQLRHPRISMRLLMVLVAILGLILGTWRTRQGWSGYSERAEYHKRLERTYRDGMVTRPRRIDVQPELDLREPEPLPLSLADPKPLNQKVVGS